MDCCKTYVFTDDVHMLMDLNSKGLRIDCPHIRGKELEEFTRKFNLLSDIELRESLEIDSATFMSVMNQCVQCVGCRRRVERLFNQLTSSGHATLDPLVLKSTKILTIAEEKLKTPQALGTLLYRHHEVLNNLLESKLRNKTRCVLHSLDAFRSKPFSETWREVWSSMKHNCRDELAVIETKELQEVLENYLKKHKFCQGCRTKIEKAYKILVGENTAKEKGFVAALYANIKKCHRDKHIHVYTNKIDFLDTLLRRAEPEVNGSYSKLRERHAKTLEIAQEEVLTCVGMIMYERLRRIYVSLREEERACQVLAAVGVHALCRSFDMSVEKKQGISNLELLYKEISRAEKAKELKRELKKLKKKKKKNEKKNGYRSCEITEDANSDGTMEEEDDDEHDEVDGDDDAVEDHDLVVQVTINDGSNTIVTDHDYYVLDGDDEEECLNEIESNISTSDAVDEIDEGLHTENVVHCNGVEQVGKRRKQKQKKPKSQKRNKKKQLQKDLQNESSRRSVSEELKSGKNGKVKTVITTCSSSASTSPTPRDTISKCDDCLAATHDCPCENDVKDSGYGSEPNSTNSNSHATSELSSPEGSEVGCSDGFCNHDDREHHSVHINNGKIDEIGLNTNFDCKSEMHEICDSLLCQEQRSMHQLLSLQEMLDYCEDSEDEDEDNCYIPQEVVLEYQCQREHVEQQRQELRETLRNNFARLCKQRAISASPSPAVVNQLACVLSTTLDCK